MENTFLHEQNTLPLIRMARLYDTIQDGRTKPTAERVADCFELGLFLSDSGSFTADGREYRIVPGLLRFTRPGQHICSSPPYRCYTVYFTLDGPVCDYLTSLPGIFHGAFEQKALLEQLITAFNAKSPGSILCCNGLLLQLLSSLRELQYSQARRCPAVQSCTEYLQQHMGEKISLETLGKHAGYSAIHIMRLFKDATGQTPHEYLTALRMKRASQMLIYTDTPVSQIGLDCGFLSESYFHAMFKKQYSISPGDYRKNAKII